MRDEGERLEGRRRRREREGERRRHFAERVRDDVCVWVGTLSRERVCFVGEGFILWLGLGGGQARG
jgi:hypothetical protein